MCTPLLFSLCFCTLPPPAPQQHSSHQKRKARQPGPPNTTRPQAQPLKPEPQRHSVLLSKHHPPVPHTKPYSCSGGSAFRMLAVVAGSSRLGHWPLCWPPCCCCCCCCLQAAAIASCSAHATAAASIMGGSPVALALSCLRWGTWQGLSRSMATLNTWWSTHRDRQTGGREGGGRLCLNQKGARGVVGGGAHAGRRFNTVQELDVDAAVGDDEPATVLLCQ